MLTMRSSIAGARRRRDRCWRPSGIDLQSADWSFTLTKTRIVYCKDDDRPGQHEHIKFDFLGYTFQPRRAKNRWGKFFISFLPAISNKAAKRSGRPSANGGWRPPGTTSAWRIWRALPTRWCGAG